MYQKVSPLFLLCETPLHAGSGSDLGVVDLPIQRERHTSYPKIESSSLKGALREDFESNDALVEVAGQTFKVNQNDPKRSKAKGVGVGYPLTLAFGPEGDEADKAHAGALVFTDARLLLFPVKSMKGVFAWITCPDVLERFVREMRLVKGYENFSIKGLSNQLGDNECQTNSNKLDINGLIILEEYTFKISSGNNMITIKVNGESDTVPFGKWLSAKGVGHQDTYWKNKLEGDIVILSNDDFRDFVNLSTEVVTRTKINNETGTVQKGGLFTEEYLPTESLLYSLVMSAPVFQTEDQKANCLLKTSEDVMNYFSQGIGLRPIIQLGGNATLGKGLLRTTLLQEIKSDENEQ